MRPSELGTTFDGEYVRRHMTTCVCCRNLVAAFKTADTEVGRYCLECQYGRDGVLEDKGG